jgi:hypothetical protein
MEKYCAEENLDFRILLISNNASAHVLYYVRLPENVKVIYMRLRSTTWMQPVDQGEISVLKSYYLCHTFKELIAETDVNNEFWQTFYILGCVQIVGESWKELSTRLMNGCWKNSYPDAVHSSEGFDVFSVTEITVLAKVAEFQDVSEDGIAELLESYSL